MCISTPHYGHSNYGDGEVCDITLKQSGTLRFDGFATVDTPWHHDVLTIDDIAYYGTVAPAGVVVNVHSSAKWVSQGWSRTDRGWKMCLVPQTPPGATSAFVDVSQSTIRYATPHQRLLVMSFEMDCTYRCALVIIYVHVPKPVENTIGCMWRDMRQFAML